MTIVWVNVVVGASIVGANGYVDHDAIATYRIFQFVTQARGPLLYALEIFDPLTGWTRRANYSTLDAAKRAVDQPMQPESDSIADAFDEAMQGRQYGTDERADALAWFRAGWYASKRGG